MLHDDQRCVEENYLAAGNTSNLRVQAEYRNDADVIIAAGWNKSRTGMALLRLHSEWDRANKPRKPTTEAIHALAATMPETLKRDDGTVLQLTKSRRHEMARAQAQAWYMGEMGAAVGKLLSLASVRERSPCSCRRQASRSQRRRCPRSLRTGSIRPVTNATG